MVSVPSRGLGSSRCFIVGAEPRLPVSSPWGCLNTSALEPRTLRFDLERVLGTEVGFPPLRRFFSKTFSELSRPALFDLCDKLGEVSHETEPLDTDRNGGFSNVTELGRGGGFEEPNIELDLREVPDDVLGKIFLSLYLIWMC